MTYSSLYQFLLETDKKNNYPFHMPGHKQNLVCLPYEFIKMDITEIPGADNLHEPQGLIAEAQEKIAALYGAKNSYMLINGASSGVLAAVLSVCAEDDEIIIARNSHRSVYHALILSGAKPVYIMPEITEYGISGGIAPEKLETLLSEHPACKAVLITSPTYEGFCSPIKSIAEVVHRHGKILIVDEAHGAHFGFHPYFPLSANTFDADLVIQSFHKTLPALNQSAVLHVNGHTVNERLLKMFLSMVQTSSPSYVLLAVMEQIALQLLCNAYALFEPYVAMLQTFREHMSNNKVVDLLGRSLIGRWAIDDIDLGKLVFLLKTDDLTGQDFYDLLSKEYGIQLEMASLFHVIAMTSYADTMEGFQRLSRSITRIDKDLNFSKNFTTMYNECYQNIGLPEQVLLPRKAYRREIVSMPLNLAVNKISGDFVVPYPPGIPLLVPGEVISEDVFQQISIYLQNHMTVLGLEAMHISVIL